VSIEQIVYLIETPFSKRDYNRFGIEVFNKHGINATVLDLTYYMDQNVAKKYHSTDNTDYPYVLKLKTYMEIKKFILTSKQNTVFVSFLGDSSIHSLKILHLLSKHNKEFGIIISGSLPLTSVKQKLSSQLKLFNLKNFFRLCLKAIYLIFTTKPKYSFVIASGSESYKTIRKRYITDNLLPGHAFDYDLYLEHQNETATNYQNYIVFLDEFLPFHPDYIRHGIDLSHIAEAYYGKLTNLFDKIEQYYNMPVVISAHPRSYYDELPDYWQGRKCILGGTISLVKNASLCLLHASTSINFAILYDKPLLFITMDEIKNSNTQILLAAMVQELQSNVIDLDDLHEEYFKNIAFSTANYEAYKIQYIKRDDSNNINNWEILYNHYLLS
jgi:hypothetical protein